MTSIITTTGVKFASAERAMTRHRKSGLAIINREEGVALVKRFDHEYPSRFAMRFSAT